MEVFVNCAGQDDNIGDSLLRRAMLSEIQKMARCHVLAVGQSEEYVAALQVQAPGQVYLDFGSWILALKDHARRGRVAYMENPGEWRATSDALKIRLRLLRLFVALRLRRAAVFALGAGSREPPPLHLKPLFRLTLALHRMVVWRDPETARWFGTGGVMPDWAYGAGDPLDAVPASPRPHLAFTFRNDRPYPTTDWLDAISAFCDEAGLTPIGVVQVRRDSERVREVARDLGCACIDWGGDTHLAHEQRIRSAYRQAAILVSDRLHALIIGVTEGCVPACVVPRREFKTDRHLRAAGMNGFTVDTAGMAGAEVTRLLHGLSARAAEVRTCLGTARSQIRGVVGEMERALRSLAA